MPLTLRIVTPRRVAWQGEANEVRLPGFHGQFGVLPDHERLLSVARPGRVHVLTEQGESVFVVGSGFAEAGPDHLTLLTDLCEPAEGVDLELAARELAQAEVELAQAQHGTAAWDEIERRIELARARLG
ncbi:MAG: ATP synthase F1 subunit epsilon [Pseudomonadota bacterium]